MTIKEALDGMRAGGASFDDLLQAVRAAPAHEEEAPDPQGIDARGHIDPEDGDFEEVTVAWIIGDLTDAQYDQLVDAANEG